DANEDDHPMVKIMLRVIILTLSFFALPLSAAPIQRIWLSHATGYPSELTICWETEAPARSVLLYGSGPEMGQGAIQGDIKIEENLVTHLEETLATRHQVSVPFSPGEGSLYYRVGEGKEISATYSVKRYPEDELRVA